MGRFFKNLGLFFMLLVAVCLLVFGFQTWNIRKKANFKFSKNYKNLMLGHSHAECAYNDSLITNFKNVATSGESYFYTFYKAKKVLEQNEAIEIVFIEFTNNQIGANMDTWIWGNKYISKFYPKYGSFIDFQDTGLLMEHNLSSVLNNFSVHQKRNFRMLLDDNYDFVQHIGGYVYYIENDLEKAIILQEKNDKNNKENYGGISDINILYLEKIVLLCKSLGKQLIFIRSPQHTALGSRDNETAFLRIYNEKFSEVPLLDFNDFEIPDYGFKDLGHLNHRGAEIISKKLDSLLKQGILNDYSMENGRRIIISH